MTFQKRKKEENFANEFHQRTYKSSDFLTFIIIMRLSLTRTFYTCKYTQNMKECLSFLKSKKNYRNRSPSLPDFLYSLEAKLVFYHRAESFYCIFPLFPIPAFLYIYIYVQEILKLANQMSNQYRSRPIHQKWIYTFEI